MTTPPAGYCTTDDLLLGNIPLPPQIDPAKYVGDAQDEIDSKIGFIYETPVNIADDSPVVRPARLLLKRINVWLASGRLILAIDSAGEDTQLHAYGASLINEANAAICSIAEGKVALPGAALVDATATNSGNGPLIDNLDPESNVEAFYNRLTGKGGHKNFWWGLPPNYPYTGDFSPMEDGEVVR